MDDTKLKFEALEVELESDLDYLSQHGLLHCWLNEKSRYKRFALKIHNPTRNRFSLKRLEENGLPIYADIGCQTKDFVEDEIEIYPQDERTFNSMLEFYNDMDYEDLKSMKPDLQGDIISRKVDVLSFLDAVVRNGEPNTKKDRLVKCLHWAFGSFKSYPHKKMYPLQEKISLSNLPLKTADLVYECTIWQRQIAALKFYVDMIPDILASKRRDEKLNLSGAIESIIRSNRDNGKKVGRKPHALAQKQSVKSVIEECTDNPDFIHQNGQHEGKHNWEKIAKQIMRVHGWDDGDIGIKTLKRKAKKIILNSSD